MRDCTYIAADFDHDKKAVDVLYQMKSKGYIVLKDAHQLQQSNDSSLACSIKKSLKVRMDSSYKFVLIVGNHTDTVSKGGCQLCSSYNSYTSSCARGHSVDYRSFIKYECDMAVKAGIKIVVLYNNFKIDKTLCPEAVRYIGTHCQMWYIGADGKYYWDYNRIARAMGG